MVCGGGGGCYEFEPEPVMARAEVESGDVRRIQMVESDA
jgi:hypothetical protein